MEIYTHLIPGTWSIPTMDNLQMAKLPQYNGKETYNKAFEVCHTSEADQELMRVFELPMTKGQAGCVTHFFWEYFQIVNNDRTINIAKVEQQFLDYDRPVPDDMNTLANINVDTEMEKLGLATFAWLKNNKDDLRFVYFGNSAETFEWAEMVDSPIQGTLRLLQILENV